MNVTWFFLFRVLLTTTQNTSNFFASLKFYWSDFYQAIQKKCWMITVVLIIGLLETLQKSNHTLYLLCSKIIYLLLGAVHKLHNAYFTLFWPSSHLYKLLPHQAPFSQLKCIVQGVIFTQIFLWLGCVTEPIFQCSDWLL